MRLFSPRFGLAGFLSMLVFWLALGPFAAAGGQEAARIARGGRLYDNWIKEIGSTILHRIEASSDKPVRRPRRCVNCHGWDYRGKDGPASRVGGSSLVKGLLGIKGVTEERLARILGDETHGYGEYLNETDRADLAKFLAKGLVAMDTMIDRETLLAKGRAASGNVFFQTICANCHGNDGQQIAEAQPLGDTARRNPWQGLHTLLNGHPSGTMPALRVLDPAMLLDTLAYVQTLPPRDRLASIVRGGRLYDTWYKENGRKVPDTVHPAYPGTPPKSINTRTTWRCKECHGWDYLGRDGVYGRSEHKTDIIGINGMVGADPSAIAAKILDAQHGYARLLSPRDVADLANFVALGQIDMQSYIDGKTLKARGDATRYAPYYHTICAACHGADGSEVRTMPPVGRIAKSDPWRALHGILNGHPGEPMPPLIAVSREAAAGILAYIQTLPAERGGGGSGQPK